MSATAETNSNSTLDTTRPMDGSFFIGKDEIYIPAFENNFYRAQGNGPELLLSFFRKLWELNGYDTSYHDRNQTIVVPESADPDVEKTPHENQLALRGVYKASTVSQRAIQREHARHYRDPSMHIVRGVESYGFLGRETVARVASRFELPNSPLTIGRTDVLVSETRRREGSIHAFVDRQPASYDSAASAIEHMTRSLLPEEHPLQASR